MALNPSAVVEFFPAPSGISQGLPNAINDYLIYHPFPFIKGRMH